jgi:Kef-type K+ transport system membrane component KefB
MHWLPDIFIAVRDIFNQHVIFGIGVLLMGGFFFGKLAQRFSLPAVTGYIVAGLLLGDSILGFVHVEMTANLRLITDIALGIVAITIGAEFDRAKLRRLGISIVIITVFQLLATFFAVSIALYVFKMPSLYAVLLGAIATATAPAATVAIIQELRARGDYVDTLYGIVALDDAGCVAIFAMAFAVVSSFGGGSIDFSNFWGIISRSLLEIVFSLMVGFFGGLGLHFLTYRKTNQNETLILSLSMILIITAVSISLHLSPLLANMMAGAVVINASPRGIRALRSIAPLTPPLYAVFFAIAGTELKLNIIASKQVLIWGIVYVLARAVGKYGGVWLGTTAAKSEKRIRNNLGLSMLPQAGVAIGLVLFIQTTSYYVGATPDIKFVFDQMVNIILFAVLINELVGPPLSKRGILRGSDI